jgi:hypothetical protein
VLRSLRVVQQFTCSLDAPEIELGGVERADAVLLLQFVQTFAVEVDIHTGAIGIIVLAREAQLGHQDEA